VAYTDDSNYSGADAAAELTAIEPALGYVVDAALSTGPTVVSLTVTDAGAIVDQVWSAAALSESGDCFEISDNATGPGTTFGLGVAATCNGTNAVAAAGGW
jgi:hypothetical protein